MTNVLQRRLSPVAIPFIAIFLVPFHSMPARADDDQPATRPTVVLTEDEKTLVAERNELAVALFKSVARNSAGNRAISPMSISEVLDALAQLQQLKDGPTSRPSKLALSARREAAISLRTKIAPANSEEEARFVSAMGAWNNSGIAPDSGLVATLAAMRIPLVTLPPRADVKDALKKWAVDQSAGHLTDPCGGNFNVGNMPLIIGNVTYLQASWDNFSGDLENSEQQLFEISPGKCVRTRMMRLFPDSVFHTSRNGADYYFLPLKAHKAFVLILPHVIDGLAKVEANLSGTFVAEAYGESQAQAKAFDLAAEAAHDDRQKLMSLLGKYPLKKLILTMPAFDCNVSMNVEQNLRAVGAGSAIAGASVTHSVRVTVNEDGVTASAATFSGLFGGSPFPPESLRADRPFLYTVVDLPSSAILFIGDVTDPSSMQAQPAEGAKSRFMMFDNRLPTTKPVEPLIELHFRDEAPTTEPAEQPATEPAPKP